MNVTFSMARLGAFIFAGMAICWIGGCLSVSPPPKLPDSLLQARLRYSAEGNGFAASVGRAIPLGASKEDVVSGLSTEKFRCEVNQVTPGECVIVGTRLDTPWDKPWQPMIWIVTAYCRDGVVQSVTGRRERVPLLQPGRSTAPIGHDAS